MRHLRQTGTNEPLPHNTGERPREACGVFAVHNYRGSRSAAEVTFLGLLALQHRGQESAGMAYYDAGGMQVSKGMGLVTQVFSPETLAGIAAPTVLGHVRYSTAGMSSIANAQPLVARSVRGECLAVAHNGNLSNGEALRRELLAGGHIFHATADTEILLAALFRHRRLGPVESVRTLMNLVQGAYSAVMIDGRRTVAFRDPAGFRPLCIGRLGGAYVFASESCALDAVGASFRREVEPGEIVVAEGDSLASYPAPVQAPRSFCIFEYIYFARPDSNLEGKSVHLVRKAVGAGLSRRIPGDVDMVIPSPDSGISAAMGLAGAAGVPLEWAIYRSPYRGRTFIVPTARGREMAARLKYNPISALVQGKKVAVVDDSLVRGTTARQLTALLRKAGAVAVHLCIASPPYCHPCYYGVDIPVSRELAAATNHLDALAGSVGADSLTYAALEDLFTAVQGSAADYCTACFTGRYPAAAGRKVEICS